MRDYIYRKLFVPLNNFYFTRAFARRPDVKVDTAFVGVPQLKTARSDISDHLPRLYAEAVSVEPDLIVELGTRGGESTLALLAAARQKDAIVLSVDVEEVGGSVTDPDLLAHWRFVHADDVDFAGQFVDWCEERGLKPAIDLLFVDTSHLYEHTTREIASWWPHLTPKATVVFHDTNLKEFYRRGDGTIGRGWNNDRGVIRAIEEYLGTTFDETLPFTDYCRGWSIDHDPLCNGLTVLRRESKPSNLLVSEDRLPQQ